MASKILNPLAVTIGAALLGSVAVATASTAFQLVDLGSGYMLAATGEGKCGEGKCGMDTMDTNKDGMLSRAEHQAHADAKFAAMDANKDGMISKDEMAKAHEGMCGEGKCGANKGKEGSCGGDKGKEGSCGGQR
jgi:uncharacterized low-complexity protein